MGELSALIEATRAMMEPLDMNFTVNKRLAKLLSIVEVLDEALRFYANRHEYSATARVGDNLWACVELDFFKPAEEAFARANELAAEGEGCRE